MTAKEPAIGEHGRQGRDLTTGGTVYVDAPDGAAGDAAMRALGVEPIKPSPVR